MVNSSIPSDVKPIHVAWDDFIYRVRVHELLRCLQAEQKKLRVLKDFLGTKEINNETSKSSSREDKVIFQRPLSYEEELAHTIAEEVRKNKQDPNYITECVRQLFMSNQKISEEQFNKILDLCKDDQEKKRLIELLTEQRNREKYLYNASEDRKMLYLFLNSYPMQMFMLAIIFLSTLVLFLLSFERINNFYSYSLIILDSIIMAVFIVEAILKIYIYKDDYFRSPANCLDLIIIITHFVEIIMDLVTGLLAMSMDISTDLWFKLLKSLRALRVLRAIKFLPNLQVILTTIIQSLISISSIAALMILFMSGRELFREQDEKRFGNFLRTLLTLFQLLTLDDWGDILEDNFYEFRMFLYLFLYIVCEYFVFLNLFVAVLVDNFQLSIEAANLAKDSKKDVHIWKERLEELAAKLVSSDSSLHSRHTVPVHELGINDYTRLPEDSRRGTLLEQNMKKLTAVDFHYFEWLRRMKLTNCVIDAAIGDKGLALGHVDPEIPPVDILDFPKPDPDDIPLKPVRVKKQHEEATESDFQIHARERRKHTGSFRRRTTVETADILERQRRRQRLKSIVEIEDDEAEVATKK